MLTDEFKEMLDNEEAQMLAIRADCARFAARESSPSTVVHTNILSDLDDFLALTRTIRKADLSTLENKKSVYQSCLETAQAGGLLSSYIRKKADCAGLFRRAALEKHAKTMSTLSQEKFQVVRALIEQLPKV